MTTAATTTNPAGHPVEPRGRAPTVAGVLTIVLMSAWFGVATGLLELAILVAWQRIESSAVLGVLQVNRHFLWMVPVACLAVFLLCGLPLISLACIWPKLARKTGAVGFGALSLFALLKLVPGLYTAAAAALALGVAHRIARRIDRRGWNLRRPALWSLGAGIVLVLVLGASTYDRVELAEGRTLAALPEAVPGAPNVLLVVLDTVRADHLSVYGYGRDTTPRLARLASRGTVFERARSAAPWTLPSHANLFTGRWPHELSVGGDQPLDATYPTLAGFLSQHGYATAGFVGNTYYCNSWYGLGRGFAHYEDYYEQNLIVSPGEALRCTALGRWLIRLAGTAYNSRPETANTPKDAERVNQDFLRWLSDRQAPERPFFAFLNYIDAHDPYLTPPGFDRYFGVKPETAADVETIRTWHRARPLDPSDREIALIRDAYDDCLAYLDEQLGRLFDELEQRGVLRDTLVIVTADHGEQLGERGFYGHGKSLYKQEVHVPLIVVGPSGIPQGKSIADPVSLREVAATIVERLGLQDASPFPGRSLARFWGVGPKGHDELILSELHLSGKALTKPKPDAPPASYGPMRSLVAGGKIYIRDGLGREEVYDLDDDPDEVHDLARMPATRSAREQCRIVLDQLAENDSVIR